MGEPWAAPLSSQSSAHADSASSFYFSILLLPFPLLSAGPPVNSFPSALIATVRSFWQRAGHRSKRHKGGATLESPTPADCPNKALFPTAEPAPRPFIYSRPFLSRTASPVAPSSTLFSFLFVLFNRFFTLLGSSFALFIRSTGHCQSRVIRLPAILSSHSLVSLATSFSLDTQRPPLSLQQTQISLSSAFRLSSCCSIVSMQR